MEVEKFATHMLPEFFLDHVRKVVEEAAWLCQFYPEADRDIVTISSWLHDIGQTREAIHSYASHKDGEPNYEGIEPHHIRGVRITREFPESINFPEDKTSQILHCIESHRTSKPPDPETIEARIVASADNLSHFQDFEAIVKIIGFQNALQKLERDLSSKFMLPEASEKALNIMNQIKNKGQRPASYFRLKI